MAIHRRAHLPNRPADFIRTMTFSSVKRILRLLSRWWDKAPPLLFAPITDIPQRLPPNDGIGQGDGQQMAVPDDLNLAVQVVAIGPIALVAVSAEPFAEYAKPLESASPFAHTFPIGNANGAKGTPGADPSVPCPRNERARVGEKNRGHTGTALWAPWRHPGGALMWLAQLSALQTLARLTGRKSS